MLLSRPPSLPSLAAVPALFAVSLLVVSPLAASGARAAPIAFGSFSLANMVLSGSAVMDGSAISLTQGTTQNQAGAAFLPSAVALGNDNAFSAAFQFQITPSASGPADGFTFLLQNGPGGTLQPGGNLGYYGRANSVAVEFDTYDNGTAPLSSGGANDTNDNHVAIDMNGQLNDAAAASPYGVGNNNAWVCDGATNPFGCMANGNIWTVLVGYSSDHLSVAVQDGSGLPDLVINQYPINIPTTIGTSTPYIGFTGSDGGVLSTQKILGFAYSPGAEYAPAVVPEPASLLLLGSGIAGLLALRRRTRT